MKASSESGLCAQTISNTESELIVACRNEKQPQFNSTITAGLQCCELSVTAVQALGCRLLTNSGNGSSVRCCASARQIPIAMLAFLRVARASCPAILLWCVPLAQG